MTIKELFEVGPDVLGPGEPHIAWDPQGKHLAVVGDTKRVQIYTRVADIKAAFPLPSSGSVIDIGWDKDGEVLAVLQTNSQIISLYDVGEKKLSKMDVGMKGPCWMRWSKVGPQLAVGTSKGNLLLYNKLLWKKIPIRGKHTKEITCGDWNDENRLALASNDRTVTISDENGKTLGESKLNSNFKGIKWAKQKQDSRNMWESTISVNMGGKTVYLFESRNPSKMVELAFQKKYGEIKEFAWFGDGYLLASFTESYVVAISTHEKEYSEELQCLKIVSNGSEISDMQVNPDQNSLACCSGSRIMIVNLQNWKDCQSFNLEDKFGQPRKLGWSRDGQILTLATDQGYVKSFLASLPILAASIGSKAAYLSSLQEITVVHLPRNRTLGIVKCPVEPNYLALGPAHVATGFNSHAWFYQFGISKIALENTKTNQSSLLVGEREYMGSVHNMEINSQYVATLVDKKLVVHTIKEPSDKAPGDVIYPEKGGGGITCFSMTADFLVFVVDSNSLYQVALDGFKVVNEFRHNQKIISVFSNRLGTRIVFTDQNSRSWLLNPIDDRLLEIQKTPSNLGRVVWDLLDSHVFIITGTNEGEKQICNTYVYSPQTIKGPTVSLVGTMEFPEKSLVLDCMIEGVVFNHAPSQSSPFTKFVLLSHEAFQMLETPESLFQKRNHHGESLVSSLDIIKKHVSSTLGVKSQSRKNVDGISTTVIMEKLKPRKGFYQLLDLNKLQKAWKLSLSIKCKHTWKALAKKTLELLDIDLAIHVYRQLEDVSIVLDLERIKHIEDVHLVAGHVAVMLNEYKLANKMFLRSSMPEEALDLQRDLLNWDQALKLGGMLRPERVPSICREYAQQLEFSGKYTTALQMYERGREEGGSSIALQEKAKSVCNAGIARCAIRTGIVDKGKKLAIQSGDNVLIKECGAILESMKQFKDAAELYVEAKAYEKAAYIYISSKYFSQAEPLMEHITTPKLHALYAKVKESEGKYEEAKESYIKARDHDSVVRLLLYRLDDPTSAFDMVRENRSCAAAKMCGLYAKEREDYRAAIEFLLLAGENTKAYEIAQTFNEIETYAEKLDASGQKTDYVGIARHYESLKNNQKAAEYYQKCGQYSRAIKLYLSSGKDEDVDAAINVLKKTEGHPERKQMTLTIHQYLTGDKNGDVKDPHYMFRLYMAIGDFKQAAKIAILIANQEQRIGTYKVAHSILFETHNDLKDQEIEVPEELTRNLCILHSYLRVRSMMKSGNHALAARLLLRVAKNISKFPAHTVPILTSTVIECVRASFMASAHHFASQLMRPEYRSSINKKYRRKIENIVRRPPGESDGQEPSSLCPYCDVDLPDTQLYCPSCKNYIPYCIITGKHMVLKEWSYCPNCKFPALRSDFLEWLESSTTCPMCHKNVEVEKIDLVRNPLAREVAGGMEEFIKTDMKSS